MTKTVSRKNVSELRQECTSKGKTEKKPEESNKSTSVGEYITSA